MAKGASEELPTTTTSFACNEEVKVISLARSSGGASLHKVLDDALEDAVGTAPSQLVYSVANSVMVARH